MKRDADLMRELLVMLALGPECQSNAPVLKGGVIYAHLLLLQDAGLATETGGTFSATELGEGVGAVVANDQFWFWWRDLSGDQAGLAFTALSSLKRQATDQTKTPPEGGADQPVQC